MLSNELYKSLREKLKDENLTSILFYGFVKPTHEKHYDTAINMLGVDSIELVDSYGKVCHGESYYSTYRFKKDDDECYIKFHGYYSYDGAEYEGMCLVEPFSYVEVGYKQLEAYA